jgi:hypothetical protein
MEWRQDRFGVDLERFRPLLFGPVQCFEQGSQALATKAEVADPLLEPSFERHKELKRCGHDGFRKALAAEGGKVVHEDAQQSAGAVTEKAETSAAGDTVFEGRVKL